MTGPAAEPRAFVDLHCHSSASFDSLSRPADIVRVAARRGLTHLAITDHERIDGALRARDAALRAEEPRVQVIIGEEIRSTDGDVIGLFLEHPVQRGMSALETIAAIHEQGGLAGIPHPFDRFRSSGLARGGVEWAEQVAEHVDYVEGYNARVPYPAANQRAAGFAQRVGLPAVAASDAHSLTEVGVAYNSLAGTIDSADDLRAALQDLTLVMGRASFFIRGMGPAVQLIQRLRGNGRVRVGSVGGPVARR